MSREELGSLLRLLVDTGRITAADAASMVVRFDLGELVAADLPVPLSQMPGRLTPMELAMAMQSTAVRLTPKQAEPFLEAATKPVTTETPPEVKRFLRERLRAHFRADYERKVAAITAAMAQGGDVAFWHKTMVRENRAYIARQMVTGTGRPLAGVEVDRLSQIAVEQQNFLYKFAAEISARRAIGAPHSEAYLQARAGLYQAAGWGVWFTGNETVEAKGDGYICIYHCVDDPRSCGACIDAQNNGPYLPNVGPIPGSVCRGYGRCRCTREVVFDMEKWKALTA